MKPQHNSRAKLVVDEINRRVSAGQATYGEIGREAGIDCRYLSKWCTSRVMPSGEPILRLLEYLADIRIKDLLP
jgi:hypothetical protein